MYLIAFACLYGTHYCQSLLPFLAKELGDKIEGGLDEISLSYFAYLALGIFVFRTSSRLLFFTPARYLERDLRFELLQKIEATAPPRINDFSSGQVYQTLIGDMQSIRGLIGFALLQIGNVIIALLVLIPKLYSFNPQLVLAYIPMFVAVIIFSVVVIMHRKYFKQVQDLQGDVQNVLMESYNAKKTIKNYSKEKSFVEHFKTYCHRELKIFIKSTRGPSIVIPLIPLGVILSFAWGGHIIYIQELGASSLILFSGFVFLLLEPLMSISWIGMVIVGSMGSWQRIQHLYSSTERPSELEQSLERQGASGMQGVVLPFWSETGTIPLEIIEGKWHVFVGKTGHGKSHLLNTLAQALKMQGKEVSYVAQEPYLYNDSLEKNIFLGHNPTQDERQQALDLLELFSLIDLVERKEDIFELEVGENGKRLSGGQAKRLCLIRSLMLKADYIIWDDPFSSVDLILEKQIILKLKKSNFLSRKTIILSSHRLSTVRFSDIVIYIEKNNGVIEQGPVGEILANENKVYEYFEKQMV